MNDEFGDSSDPSKPSKKNAKKIRRAPSQQPHDKSSKSATSFSLRLLGSTTSIFKFGSKKPQSNQAQTDPNAATSLLGNEKKLIEYTDVADSRPGQAVADSSSSGLNTLPLVYGNCELSSATNRPASCSVSTVATANMPLTTTASVTSNLNVDESIVPVAPPPVVPTFQIKLRVSSLNDENDLKVNVSACQTVAALKAQVQELTRIEPSCQRMFFGGKTLKVFY